MNSLYSVVCLSPPPKICLAEAADDVDGTRLRGKTRTIHEPGIGRYRGVRAGRWTAAFHHRSLHHPSAEKLMHRTIYLSLPLFALAAVAHAQNPNPVPKDPSPWKQHAMDRPAPPVVTPGPYVGPVAPPSDAIVLFDGRSLAEWRAADTTRGAARWRIDHGDMVIVPGTGDIATRRRFGDVQLHIEWSAPNPARGTGQDRGNSGVFLMSTYEIQVLDSYHASTYPDGQAAAIFGEFPPLVNAMRPPGEWQVYDIIFHRPHFDAAGLVTAPARVTVLHNGVLVQDNVTILGPTTNGHRTAYSAHPDRLPLQLQDHGHKVRFRNVWVRELPEHGG